MSIFLQFWRVILIEVKHSHIDKEDNQFDKEMEMKFKSHSARDKDVDSHRFS